MQITGILLAAGSASRFGSDKLAAQLPDGTPVAVAAARTLRVAVPDAVAVVRPGATRLAGLLAREGLHVLECPGAAHGMGVSLAWSVRHSAKAGGWVVALGDMPFVQPQTIALIAGELRAGASIAAPVYEGRRGHPVGFSMAHREALEALADDAGARDILAEAADSVTLIEVDDPGVLRDIDTPEDLPRA